jgi:hypothetical protein
VFNSAINWLFGCGHKRVTFPQTPTRQTLTSTGHRQGTYVVCLECGQEFQYDWSQMTIGDAVPVRQYAIPFKTVVAPHGLTIRKAETSQIRCELDF